MVKRRPKACLTFLLCGGTLVWGRGFPGKYLVMYNNKHGLNPNTHFSVDLKTLLRKDRLAKVGKNYLGVLRRDVESDEFRYDEHFTFVETIPSTTIKRNPKVYEGKHITITRKDDGTYRPNFKPMREEDVLNLARYTHEVYVELCEGLSGLIEEG